MAARSAYTALTPELATFPPSGRSGVTFLPVPEDDERLSSPTSPDKLQSKVAWRWRKAKSYFLDLIENNTGLLLVGASQFFFALMNVAVKLLNNLDSPVPTLELIFVRMAITYICSQLYMYWKNVPDPILGPKGVRLLLVFRGFIGFFGLFGVYYSLSYLSLSDATVLTFLAPIFTGFTGALFLKEPFSRKELLAGLCSFLGVVLIARPHFIFGSKAEADPSEKGTPEQRLVAVGVALIGVLGATGAYTSIRAIGKRAHPLHSLTFFSSQCVVVSSIAMIFLRIPIVIPRRVEWIAMLIMIGIFGFIAQTLLTMGLQRETAGRGTLAVYIGIIFAIALERMFFHVSPPPLSIAGTVIIMTSAIYVALTKENAKPKQPTQISLEIPGESALEEGLLDRGTDEAPPIDDQKEADGKEGEKTESDTDL
ncbi:DUF6-domain-containing protein [Artomyces pyxidatus]|uniref:DUF6-domain-containing protein n=1 Tax=Artomyces pyxidatus TaxID=48021 RepID=A0ACB8T9B8_9AGAM|nr:DUF6-domain-containing protein [Artomyces pyxidatus]